MWWTILQIAAPSIIRLIGMFFRNKDEREEAQRRFIKFVQNRAHYSQQPVDMNKRYKKIREKTNTFAVTQLQKAEKMIEEKNEKTN